LLEHASKPWRRREPGRHIGENRPLREGVEDLRCGARILAEPVGEIAVARRVVEFDGLLKMIMSGEVVAEINAGVAANAVRDQGLGAIRPGRGFA